jgi:hypothetical protein
MKKLNLIIIGIAFLASCNNSPKPEAIAPEGQDAGKIDMHHSSADHTSAGKAEDLSITHSGEEISLEELFGNIEKYDGKEVTVKGVVVKINTGIMDRNWIHIQDGTSFEDQFDLTVTITDDVSFGLNDIVAFKGSITLDKDFGAGYLYDVIMENASQVIKDE